jgi:hypothetical protein
MADLTRAGALRRRLAHPWFGRVSPLQPDQHEADCDNDCDAVNKDVVLPLLRILLLVGLHHCRLLYQVNPPPAGDPDICDGGRVPATTARRSIVG